MEGRIIHRGVAAVLIAALAGAALPFLSKKSAPAKRPPVNFSLASTGALDAVSDSFYTQMTREQENEYRSELNETSFGRRWLAFQQQRATREALLGELDGHFGLVLHRGKRGPELRRANGSVVRGSELNRLVALRMSDEVTRFVTEHLD